MRRKTLPRKKASAGPCGSSPCEEVLNHLYEYVNRHDLTPDLDKQIHDHLDLCRGCFTRFEFEQRLLERLKKAGDCCCPKSLIKKIKALVKNF